MRGIEIKEYSFSYPGESEKAVDGISLDISGGDFVLLCGASGSGKTTLLRSLKPEVTPAGKKEGRICIDGAEISEMEGIRSASIIGFVFQSPENQLVTDTVWHELSFGLENIGLDTNVIRRRVAETAHFFGIGTWFDKKVNELSGGQKQILNLAAVMAMQPDLVVLDEPTSQLDPIAAKEFLTALFRVNTELGTTVIISEHRLGDVIDMASTVVFMEKGKKIFAAGPKDFCEAVMKKRPEYAAALPEAARIGNLAGISPAPLTVGECRASLIEKGISVRSIVHEKFICEKHVLFADSVWFRYSKDSDFVLKGAGLAIGEGEIHAVVGGNGSGKSTFLKVLCGVKSISRGRVKLGRGKRCAMLMQNPKSMMVCDSLFRELCELRDKFGYTEKDVESIMDRYGISHLSHRHPYDLSGGELQKAALAKLMLTRPDILLLDEPTKGIDPVYKNEIKKNILSLKEEGKSIVIVTHDLDFAAGVSDRCSLMFNGEVVCSDSGKSFFAGNSYYTTAVNRITRGLAEGCVVPEDVCIE